MSAPRVGFCSRARDGNGRVRPRLSMALSDVDAYGDGGWMTPREARLLARKILAAADRLDEWAARCRAVDAKWKRDVRARARRGGGR